jgi:hypothetical protein
MQEGRPLLSTKTSKRTSSARSSNTLVRIFLHVLHTTNTRQLIVVRFQIVLNGLKPRSVWLRESIVQYII